MSENFNEKEIPGLKEKSILLVNPELKPFLSGIEDFDLRDETLADARRAFEQITASPAPPTHGVVVSERKILARDEKREINVVVYQPQAKGNSLPVILHIHGGGFVMGHPMSDDADNRRIAGDGQCVIVSVAYSLSPEAKFPQAIEECYSALLWLGRNAAELGADPTRIAVMGESAGGGLAASLAILARNRGEVPICFQVLTYPMLDYKTGSTLEQNPNELAGAFIWGRANNCYGWSSLLGTDYLSQSVSPYASAAQAADLSGLPPAFITVGSLDLFVDEGIDYARRLIRAGVTTELHVIPGAFHAFDLFPGTGLKENFQRQRNDALKAGFAVS